MWEHEATLNRFVLARVDSVKALVAKGHRYKAADYFRDLKDVWDYADQVTPWSRFTLSLSELVSLQDRDESLTSQEQAALRCELLGVCEKESGPTDWRAVARWFLGQYLLGLLPALLMCLILARQGRIRFSLKRSPISALLYLALWPINLGYRIVVALQDIDREARLRLQKDSVFGRLSGLEEEFLANLRSRTRGEEVLGARKRYLRYGLAVFAVLIMRIVPAVAQSTDERAHETAIELAMHDPPSDHDDPARIPMAIFALERFTSIVTLRIVWWQRGESGILVGYSRSVEHVPLSDAS